jgi:hypothetical protein
MIEEILSFVCCELDCYLDELKGTRRGEISKKRKLAVLVLVWKNLKKSEIAKILNKDVSSIKSIINNSNLADYIEAKELLRKYNMWKNYAQMQNYS